MKIDRTNYEIWFTDWLDDSLTQSQSEELKLFLDENPDLREEFNEIRFMKLEPSVIHFTDKEGLKKTPDEISHEQFEYLCIACLEKELSPDQQNELMEIISSDTEKSRAFRLIAKTKLSPPDLKYKNRKQLLRRTPTQKIFQFTVLGLSAAAVIAALVLVGPFRPTDQPEKIRSIAVINPGNSNMSPERIPSNPDENNTLIRSAEESTANSPGKSNSNAYPNIREVMESDDPLTRVREVPGIIIQKIAVSAPVISVEEPLPGLIAALPQSISTPEEYEGSKIGRFIAKNFRSKIMKENIPDDSPLKSYEIAEAGITGINKLLGWEMALGRNNDENGDLKSVYFSSKMLKFNVPVKKSTLSQ